MAYFTDNRCLQLAIVAFIHKDKTSSFSDRPIVNLCRITEKGYVMTSMNINPGYFDDATGKWKILCRWMFLGEVPDDAQGYNYDE